MTEEIRTLELRLAELEYEKAEFPPSEASNEDFMLILEISDIMVRLNQAILEVS